MRIARDLNDTIINGILGATFTPTATAKPATRHEVRASVLRSVNWTRPSNQIKNAVLTFEISTARHERSPCTSREPSLSSRVR